MVAACCRLCYDQYLNKNRTLNEEKLQQRIIISQKNQAILSF